MSSEPELVDFPPDCCTLSEYVPYKDGLHAFVILIRDSNDPERSPRRTRLAKMKKGEFCNTEWLNWKKKLKTTSVETLADEICAHLDDGVSRTFNRIGVEMLDKTADILFQTKFEEALWLAVQQGRVEYTVPAPVLFRKRTSLAWVPRRADTA